MGVPLSRVIVLALALGAAGACGKIRAEAPAELPPLNVPPVPPRVIAPLPPAPVAEAPAESEPVDTPPAARPRPPATSALTATAPTASPADEPAAAAVEAPLELRMPQGEDDAQVERQIRERLLRADAMLRQIEAATLRADARVQYDTARRFSDQGAAALRARNYVFASYLADKAETMARELLRR